MEKYCILGEVISLTVTNEVAAGSWYCVKSASTGSWTMGLALIRLLTCISNSITYEKINYPWKILFSECYVVPFFELPLVVKTI